MKHYCCYWCSRLVPEDQAVSARLNGGVYWWHRSCSKVDPLYHEKPQPAILDYGRDRWLDE